MLLVGTDAGATIWAFDAAFSRWHLAAELGTSNGGSRPVAAVDWAETLGRPHDLVAVAHGSSVTVWLLRSSATDLQVCNKWKHGLPW